VRERDFDVYFVLYYLKEQNVGENVWREIYVYRPVALWVALEFYFLFYKSLWSLTSAL